MAATDTAAALESLKRYRDNLVWAKQNRESLERYAGKFVAVAQGKVLDASEDRGELETRYSTVPGVYIAAVVKRGTRWIL